MTQEQYELKVTLPRQIAYEQSKFGNLRPCIVGAGPECPTIDHVARQQHAALVERQTQLAARLRRQDILDRWVMRKFPKFPRFVKNKRPAPSPFTAMKIDEVIEGHRIVDHGYPRP